MNEFDKRNHLKQMLNEEQWPPYAKVRQVWFAHLGQNLRHEEDWKWEEFLRPVLLVKRVGNLWIAVPLTTGGKDSKFYYRLPNDVFWKTSRIILSQIKAIDHCRLLEKMTTIEEDLFSDILKKLKDLVL